MSSTHGCEVKKVNFEQFRESFNIFVYGLTEHPAPSQASEMTCHQGEVNLWLEFFKCLFGLSVHTLPIIVVGLIEKYTPTNKDDPKRKYILHATLELKKQMNELLGGDGIFLFPSHPEVAPKHKTTLLKLDNTSYTAIFNMLYLPVTQCPLRLSKDGIPLGCQIVASAYNDHLSIAVAQELERVYGGWNSPCKIAI